MKFNLTWKIWILILALIFSLISIFGLPPTYFQEGAFITSVEPNSTAFAQGIREGQIITSVDNVVIKTAQDYLDAMQGKFTSNSSIRTDIILTNSEAILFTNKAPEITVSDIPKTNVKLGLDLIGGSRALVRAEGVDLSATEARDLVDTTQNRLNEFGLTDIKVRHVSDLEGQNFMLVEVAGANPSDIREMISQQGKFEAKIGNETVFVGGERDISSVCRDSRCAYIERCNQVEEGYQCDFRFDIFLTESAATRHAEATGNLTSESTSQGRYLEYPLDLYLDNVLVDSLLISEGLRGRVVTQISISGGASEGTRDEAIKAAENQMHKLQTILITGSLPYKLEIVKLDTISPLLGQEFLRVIFLAGLASLGLVALVIFGRYRKLKSSLSLLLTSVSEIIIIFGIAALIEWNLDLPSIAGILIVVGTGIDQQIIVLDEARYGTHLSLKQKMKRAFTIILGSYFTAVVAMFPLLWAGAGLLKGFAFTTLIGITSGILITRPAFTDMVQMIEKE
ncbi:MAG: PDZ domain-containing protein [Nanoarchaeota archaeon]|nr:PDZ domain-containing protein [Nanoarchaeota archaeon]